jgi:hypothetical protein
VEFYNNLHFVVKCHDAVVQMANISEETGRKISTNGEILWLLEPTTATTENLAAIE